MTDVEILRLTAAAFIASIQLMTKSESDDSREWLTAKELAALLGYRVATIYGWRYRRQGPPGYRPSGGSLRFREADVEQWLELWRDPPSQERS
jgi:excisionase family DNA binding protein